MKSVEVVIETRGIEGGRLFRADVPAAGAPKWLRGDWGAAPSAQQAFADARERIATAFPLRSFDFMHVEV